MGIQGYSLFTPKNKIEYSTHTAIIIKKLFCFSNIASELVAAVDLLDILMLFLARYSHILGFISNN